MSDPADFYGLGFVELPAGLNDILHISAVFVFGSFADLWENWHWFKSVASTSSSNITWTFLCCSLLCLLSLFICKHFCGLTEIETFQEESPNAASMSYSFQQQEQGNLASVYSQPHRAWVAVRAVKRFSVSLAQGGVVCGLISHCITLGSHVAAKLIIMFPAAQRVLIVVYCGKYKYGFQNKSLTYMMWYEKARDSGEGAWKKRRKSSFSQGLWFPGLCFKESDNFLPCIVWHFAPSEIVALPV